MLGSLRFLSLLGCLLLSACMSTRPFLSGVYQHQAKDYVARLELTALDSSFRYSWKAMDVNAGCHGTWVHRRDTLYLRCAAEAMPAPLSSGYLTNRTPTAVVRPGNRIRFEGIVLTRTK